MKSLFVFACLLGAIFTFKPDAALAAEPSGKPICLKDSSETTLSLLQLPDSSFTEEAILDAAAKILSTDADVIVKEISNPESTFALCAMLKEKYAYFFYEPAKGWLIASKYPIVMDDASEECLDFVVYNKDKSLGHIYVTNLNERTAIPSQRFGQILEKMQNNFLQLQGESIPFLLCGNLGPFKLSSDINNLIKAYFFEENNKAPITALLLQSLPISPEAWISSGYTISTTSIDVLNGPGFLTLVKSVAASSGDVLKNIADRYLQESGILLCKGEASVSVSKDNEGNTSAGASVSISDRSDRGVEFSAGASVEVSRDSSGNIDVEAKTSGTIKW